MLLGVVVALVVTQLLNVVKLYAKAV